MMITFIFVWILIILLFFVVGIRLLVLAVDDGGYYWSFPIIYYSVLFGVWSYLLSESEMDRPCVEWETHMIYNGKTAMPAKFCVNRGEWVGANAPMGGKSDQAAHHSTGDQP